MDKQFLSLFLSFTVVLSGCSNIFEKMAVKDTDAALYEDATKALDASNWDLSLEKFGQLSPAYLESLEVKAKYAGALAGKCGMNFSSLLTSLSSADLSTTPAFKYFMNLFTDKTVNPTYCTLAEAQIKQIWAQRTAKQSEQLFMVLLSMAKMGAYLRAKADKDGASSLGDGSTDGTFNGCSNVDDTDHLTDAEVTEVITGFSLMLLNITAFTATTFSGVSGSITSITTACGLLTPNPCATTEASAVTAPMIDQMRDILETNAAYVAFPVGIGLCGAATPIGSCCP